MSHKIIRSRCVLPIGTIISGTMQNRDVIPALVSAIDDVREQIALPGPTTEAPEETMRRSRLVGRIDDLLGEAERLEESDDREDRYDTEDADEIRNDLFDLAGELAPPYCYVGSTEGDGSDYGCWPSMDSVEEDARDGEILKVDDSSEIPADFSGTVLVVSDHGNASLYRAENGEIVEEFWSIV